MILQALTNYYEQLLQDGKVGKNGWSRAKVSYAITIDQKGKVRGIVPLESIKEDGKKIIPTVEVPYQKGRSRKISPNFLCDNAKYLLGAWTVTDDLVLNEKNKKQAIEYFLASKEYHQRLLGKSQSSWAKSICDFFDTWDFETFRDQFDVDWEKIIGASNLVFRSFETRAEYQNILELKEIWNSNFANQGNENVKRCLVTGERSAIARLHPLLKGVQGAQSSGAALVSFNGTAFESYGKQQGDNAPVSEYAANAYGSTLNYLLGDKAHRRLMGDTTVVFWAENGMNEYSDFLGILLGDTEQSDEDKLVRTMSKISRGEKCTYEDVELKPETKFYILGLSPNAARVSVRFFYNSTFGKIIANMNAHYERMKIVKPMYEETEYPTVREILYETVNKKSSKKQVQPILVGAVMKALVQNQRYPAALYSHILLRIRSEKYINRNKAAIVKAYIIKNYPEKKEVVETVELNSNTTYLPYVLGRLFAVLEDIQKQAIEKETIKDRYFNSACSTPAVVFPQMMKLANSHMRVLAKSQEKIKQINYARLKKQMRELMGKINESYPKNLLLEDQGIFIIGYYHQVQEFYTKKEKNEDGQEV